MFIEYEEQDFLDLLGTNEENATDEIESMRDFAGWLEYNPSEPGFEGAYIARMYDERYISIYAIDNIITEIIWED